MFDKEKMEKIEREHMEKMSKKSQEHLSQEYLDIKNLEIILVDLVPYERKAQMIDGFNKLFQNGKQSENVFSQDANFDFVPDIKKSGYGGTARIGIIFNSDIGWKPFVGIKRDLPKEFLALEIWLGQSVDFTYFVLYHCRLKKEFYNEEVKEKFVESEDWIPRGDRAWVPKGPKHEPTIRKYQKDMENFLKEFSCGLFLNPSAMSKIRCCPNMKIISTKKIDFDSFEDWEKKYLRLISFLGLDVGTYSKRENLLVSFQEDELFEKPGINAGLIFLASEEDFKVKESEELESEICRDVEWFLLDPDFDLMAVLLSIYWAYYKLEVDLDKWERDIGSYRNKMFSSSKLNGITLIYQQIIGLRHSFTQHFFNEKWNLRRLKEILAKCKIASSVTPIKTRNKERNVFEYMLSGAYQSLELEDNQNESLKNQFESLFKYCQDLTNIQLNQSNIELQKSMKKMTIVMVVLTIATLIVAMYSILPSLIEFLKQLKKP